MRSRQREQWASGTTDITLQYDVLNRVTNMVDAAGTNKYTYYAGGLLRTEGGLWASDTVTNFYNNARLRSGLHLQQPTGTWTNGFTYDAAHRLATVSFSGGTFTNAYKGPGNLLTNLSLPKGAKITNAFDNVARLTGTYLVSSGGVLNKHEYLYNTGNQRIRHTWTDGSYYTNTYDNIGQLKWADSTLDTEDRGYLYDTGWNLNKRTNNPTEQTFVVNEKNELLIVVGPQQPLKNKHLSTGIRPRADVWVSFWAQKAARYSYRKTQAPAPWLIFSSWRPLLIRASTASTNPRSPTGTDPVHFACR